MPQPVAKLDLGDFGREKGQQLVAQLGWGQNVLLMQKIKDLPIRFWYMRQVIEQGWGRDTLGLMIKSKAHERQGTAITNFENRLPAFQSDLARQLLKDPYIFDFLTLTEPFEERELEVGLVQHLEKFLLERLTTRPEHIQQLRQTIFNLAVCGKLVPQDPNDEPVSDLLRRISLEQQGLAEKGLLKLRHSRLYSQETSCFSIPKEWLWVSLANLISFGPQNGISPKPTNNEKAPKALTLTATTSGFFDANHYKHVELNETDCENYWLSPGDVLFQRGNTREYVGIAAVFYGPERSFVFPDLMIRVRFSESLDIRYIHMALISPPLRGYFSAMATGASSSMPKISQGSLLNASIPIPPLPEQQRMVKKVDELMAVCDQLETRLTSSTSSRGQLINSALHKALNGKSEHQRAIL